MPAPSDVITLSNATRRYGARVAVDDASLTLKPGQITALLGPSGSGKSTILRMIAGLEPLDGGTLHAGDLLLADASYSLPPEHRDLGLVFQDYALFPHLSVADNVAFGLKAKKAERLKQALYWLDQVHLKDRADAWPHMLSGGEQQRVALVRALARQPRAILLDEPFSGLDRHLKSQVRRSLIDTLRASGKAVLIVTHDAEEALMMADELILMDGGKILQSGTPEDCYNQPVSLSAARLLGETEVLDAIIQNGLATTAFGSLPSDLPDGPAKVMTRPESLTTSRAEEGARVTARTFGGAFIELTMKSGEQVVSLRTKATDLQIGDTVQVHFDPKSSAIFAA